ncbi:hypothetical protein H0241_19830 [Mesorhizobium sp. CCANP35]|uniref:Solute-binding protein family 5 domain-containing protein n=1 Tax=Mesorhizobium neociceri TaxID=1307853 RepID=A0A838BAW3_9HYPH|nr:hypothetical protein [Mesorhizobium neociceri]
MLYFSGFFSTRAVDSVTVEIKTSIPVPLMPVLMSYLGIGKAPADATTLSREPLAPDPYQFVSWTPGQSILVTKFTGYWGEAGAVDNATYVSREQSAVRAAMVATGEADLAWGISSVDVDNPDDRLHLPEFRKPSGCASTSTNRRWTMCVFA